MDSQMEALRSKMIHDTEAFLSQCLKELRGRAMCIARPRFPKRLKQRQRRLALK